MNTTDALISEMLAALVMAEKRLLDIEHFTSQHSRATVSVIRAAITRATAQ